MGSKGITFFAFICLISAARGWDERTQLSKVIKAVIWIGGISLCLMIIRVGIWCCCGCPERDETYNLTVVSAGGGGGGPNQNNFDINMPTQTAMPQPYAPMPQYTQ